MYIQYAVYQYGYFIHTTIILFILMDKADITLHISDLTLWKQYIVMDCTEYIMLGFNKNVYSFVAKYNENFRTSSCHHSAAQY